MPYEQCTECGRNLPAEEMRETGFDDDGMGGIIADYICSDCEQAIQVDDYWHEMSQWENRNDY